MTAWKQLTNDVKYEDNIPEEPNLSNLSKYETIKCAESIEKLIEKGVISPCKQCKG